MNQFFCIYSGVSRDSNSFQTKVKTNRSIRINSFFARGRFNIDIIDLDKCSINFAFQITLTY